ncbi:MAG TPA: haloacid dehalogenase type II [Thermomicrobiales bacterium]|nr:haloacid dehalogenase type II [Thermomicrobiales bacterium]
MATSTRQRVLVFDVNETLLDVGALDPIFTRVFDDVTVRREWFGQMLQLAFVSTITQTYRDFGALGMAALAMVADRHGVTIGDETRTTLRDEMRQLPPHPEVRQALERLRDAKFRMATLTNSTTEVGELQVTNAGLRDLFEQTLSGDSVQRLKPAPEPYRMAAERLGIPIERLRLVAAHAWDIAGALNAGCAAAFVARPGQVLDPEGAQPDIIGADLGEVADRILDIDR